MKQWVVNTTMPDDTIRQLSRDRPGRLFATGRPFDESSKIAEGLGRMGAFGIYDVTDGEAPARRVRPSLCNVVRSLIAWRAKSEVESFGERKGKRPRTVQAFREN